jgi:hypothetical protein
MWWVFGLDRGAGWTPPEVKATADRFLVRLADGSEAVLPRRDDR